jgi:tetratricopeptide (TPR) repeat protein
LISSLAGWWGIPWGFVYTPLTLFKLAKGGEIPEDINIEMLARVAVHKLDIREPEAAMDVFQEALRIKEDERTRNSLMQLKARYPLSTELKDIRIPVWFVLGFLASSLFGIGLGLLDYLVTTFFGWILGAETYFLLALLTWAPFLAFILMGAIILNEALGWLFSRTRTDHLLIGLIVALGCSALIWYGIPQGYLIGDYFSAIINGLDFESIGDFIMTTGAVITQGGFWFMFDAIESGLIGDVIYLIILGIAGILYAWLGIRAARESVLWQVRLELLRGDLRREEPRSLLPTWGAIGGYAFALLLGFMIFAGRGRLLRGGPDLVAYMEQGDEYYLSGDYSQAEQAFRDAIQAAPAQPGPHDSLGWTLYSVGRFEEAAQEFSTASDLDPAWADPHIGLAYVYLSNGDQQAAETEFQTALELADDPYYVAQAYYGLGNLAHQRDDLEIAIAFYQQAVREDWQLAIAHLDMAIAYYAMGDFSRTIEHATDIIGIAPEWGAPHGLLALAHYQLDQSEDMVRELDWAEDLDSQDIYSQFLIADIYWELEQFDQAKTVLEAAKIQYPENSQVPLLLARIAAIEGLFEQAEQLIEEQLGRDPMLVEGYLSRAYVKIERQDLGQAEADLGHVLDINPENWEAHSLLSFVYFHQGRAEEAFQTADVAIQLYNYNGGSYVSRAFASRALGNLDAAYSDAQQAIHLSPKLDLAHFILGVIQLDRGESEAGAASLRIFLELARDRAYVRDYIQQAQAVLDQLP